MRASTHSSPHLVVFSHIISHLAMAFADNESLVVSSIAALSTVDGAWEFLRNYEPEEGKGFMFSTLPPKGREIEDALMRVNPSHSGASLALLMRHMQSIARTQQASAADAAPPAKEAAPHSSSTDEKRSEFLALGKNMTLPEQIHEFHKHWNTPMTYMEMRQRFG